jgi:glycosyltransferase involved in cell wall biosynthesis
MSSVVTWHGRVADPAPHLEAADALIHLPTRADPLPTAVLEAQAWSLPVIGREIGGIAEIVDRGQSGLLTRSADPAVAAGLILQLCQPGTAERMRTCARANARRRFSPQDYADRFDDWLAAVAAA